MKNTAELHKMLDYIIDVLDVLITADDIGFIGWRYAESIIDDIVYDYAREYIPKRSLRKRMDTFKDNVYLLDRSWQHTPFIATKMPPSPLLLKSKKFLHMHINHLRVPGMKSICSGFNEDIQNILYRYIHTGVPDDS